MKRVLATLAFGEQGRRWHALSGPSQRAYAARCGAEYVVLEDSPRPGENPLLPKLLAPVRLARLFGPDCRLLLADADVTMAPQAPDLWAKYPAGFAARRTGPAGRAAPWLDAIGHPSAAAPMACAGLYLIDAADAPKLLPHPPLPADRWLAEEDWVCWTFRDRYVEIAPADSPLGAHWLEGFSAFHATHAVNHYATLPARERLMRAAPVTWREPQYEFGKHRAAVVIGGVGRPGLLELQVRLLRELNGDGVPVMYVSDCDWEAWEPEDGETAAHGEGRWLRTLDYCDRAGVRWRNSGPEKIGHMGGDLGVFDHGVRFAASVGAEYLFKISVRTLPTRPDWLAEAVALFDRHPRYTLLGRYATKKGRFGLPLRTELIGLRVPAWATAQRRLRARNLGGAVVTEDYLAQVWGGVGLAQLLAWPVLGRDRHQPCPDVLSHYSHPAEAFESLAVARGIDLAGDHRFRGVNVASRYVFG